MVFAPIARLEKFTGKEDDVQAWINNVTKAIMVNNWDDQRALQAIPYFLQDTADSWYQSLAARPQIFQEFKLDNIPSATVTNDKTLATIFSFKLEETKIVPLFSGAALEEKPIMAMYTDTKVDGHLIKLILDNRSAGSIITRQLMDQLGCRVD
ncbi:hypothetical protein G9A89_008015 [Geosiphon pyriformis]|nr:hypothetical protein G9A89_008015 [Geosiphon pyriformis]